VVQNFVLPFQNKILFEKIVQNFELKRVGEALKGHLFASLPNPLPLATPGHHREEKPKGFVASWLQRALVAPQVLGSTPIVANILGFNSIVH